MEKKSFFKFLFRLGAFCVVLIVIDQLLGFALRKAYFSEHIGQYYQTTYAIDSADAKIMIFGSSRAVRHYSAPIISKVSGLSCYNSGRDAQMIPYPVAVEEATLIRTKPKLVILDINPWDLAINQSKYERLTLLLPYALQHPEFIKYVDEISPFERYKLFSKVYPYNSTLFIIASNTLFPGIAKKDSSGYLPLKSVMTKPYMQTYINQMKERSAKFKQKKEIADEKAVAYLKLFLNNTKKRGIKTLIIISPTIIKNPFYLDNQTTEKDLIIAITKKFPNATFLDYSSDARFNYHYEKFADEFHLNERGAEEFSTALAGYIKDNKIIKE